MTVPVENSVFYVDPVTDKVFMEEEQLDLSPYLDTWTCMYCGAPLLWDAYIKHVEGHGRCLEL